MTGFSSEWLALREPADHAARDAGLMQSLGEALARDDRKSSPQGGAMRQPKKTDETRTVSIVDLGCGTGSNLRALGPWLPERQSWRLVDHDPALLNAARQMLTTWADESATRGDGLILRKGDRHIRVALETIDLSAGPGSAIDPLAPPDLVTAAALFDLVSDGWAEGLAASIAAAGAIFYTALSYDGRETWAPPHPADGAVQDAFLAHQRGDKGFGTAMGPRATAILASAFTRHGYAVTTAPSPWRLGDGQRALIDALRLGKVAAVAETGLVPAGDLDAWSTARGRPGTTANIGHDDLLAMPPHLPGLQG